MCNPGPDVDSMTSKITACSCCTLMTLPYAPFVSNMSSVGFWSSRMKFTKKKLWSYFEIKNEKEETLKIQQIHCKAHLASKVFRQTFFLVPLQVLKADKIFQIVLMKLIYDFLKLCKKFVEKYFDQIPFICRAQWQTVFL